MSNHYSEHYQKWTDEGARKQLNAMSLDVTKALKVAAQEEVTEKELTQKGINRDLFAQLLLRGLVKVKVGTRAQSYKVKLTDHGKRIYALLVEQS